MPAVRMQLMRDALELLYDGVDWNKVEEIVSAQPEERRDWNFIVMAWYVMRITEYLIDEKGDDKILRIRKFKEMWSKKISFLNSLLKAERSNEDARLADERLEDSSYLFRELGLDPRNPPEYFP